MSQKVSQRFGTFCANSGEGGPFQREAEQYFGLKPNTVGAWRRWNVQRQFWTSLAIDAAYVGTLWLFGPAEIIGQQYVISTVAGGAPPPVPASAIAAAFIPEGIAIDGGGNVYLSSDKCIFRSSRTALLLELPAHREKHMPGMVGRRSMHA